jgi:hypothetical protein
MTFIRAGPVMMPAEPTVTKEVIECSGHDRWYDHLQRPRNSTQEVIEALRQAIIGIRKSRRHKEDCRVVLGRYSGVGGLRYQRFSLLECDAQFHIISVSFPLMHFNSAFISDVDSRERDGTGKRRTKDISQVIATRLRHRHLRNTIMKTRSSSAADTPNDQEDTEYYWSNIIIKVITANALSFGAF